jgi:asparagine synthase (glutamine-hydrolysing)
LKTLLGRLIPKHLVERPKTGFNPPLEGLINTIGKERLKREMIPVGAYINLNAVNTLIIQHFSGEANNVYKLWQLLYFSRWLKLKGEKHAA